MKILYFVVGYLLSIASCAQIDNQAGYRLDFEIRGLEKDTIVYLGYYYGESTYLSDTALVGERGRFHFEGAESLPQGVYFLVMDRVRLFDIAMGEDQRFKAVTSTDDYIGDMKIEGSEDNRLLFENMIFNAVHHEEAAPFIKTIQDSLASDKQQQDARTALAAVDKTVLEYQNELIATYPETITARWLKVTQPVVMPDSFNTVDGSTKRAARYWYYRKHFFDHIDLSDDALIRLPSPIYSEKLLEYLDQIIPTIPDSIFNAIKELADKTKTNQETYKYLVWNALTHYQKPKFMGLDEVYVDLYDYYFASGKMDFWISDGVKKNVREYADKLRLSLIGHTAPNLIMQDADLALRSLYDLKNRYVIIYFFDPDCGHCATETPKLVDFYKANKKRFALEVYAVCSDTSMQKMKNYIRDKKMPWVTVNGPRTTVGSYSKLYDVPSMPTLYVIDEKKKIIAKKPPIDILADFFENYERIQKMNQDTTASDTM